MPTYNTMPYLDPKLNTPELIAARKNNYIKNGGNLTGIPQVEDPFEAWKKTNYVRPTTQFGESYEDFKNRGGSDSVWDLDALRQYEKVNPEYGKMHTMGDPDTSGGEYRPTLPTDSVGEPDPNGSGGFQIPPWLQNIIGGIGKGFENATTSPMLAPALATAYQYYQNADKYGNMAGNFAKEANPFGDRSQYVQGLSDLYNDPSSLENSAAYKFRLAQGLNQLGPQLAAKGGGYGNSSVSMMQLAQDMASQEYDKEWARRYEAAGGKFDPANSVNAQLNAYKLETDARNAALGALFTPFGAKPGGTTINNNNSGGNSNGGGGSGGGVQNPGSIGKNPFDNSTGNLGSSGTWITSGANIGKYMLSDGTVLDIEKLSAAARGGDPDAIQWLTRISGGGSVDEQIRNLGSYPGGNTGDPYNPELPYNPEEGMYPQLPSPEPYTPTNPPVDYDFGTDSLGGLDLSFNSFGP